MNKPLPSPESLHMLMIALGDEVLTGWGDTRERHLEYAERIGHLHMVVYSPLSRDLKQTTLSDHLTVYPTRSATRVKFVWDAYQIGARIIRSQPIGAITTQDPFTTGLAGVWLKKQFGIPLDLQNHSDFFDNRYWIAERPLRYGAFNLLGKWVIRQGDTHRVLNQIEKAKYVAMGIPDERVQVLSTPVRLGRFAPEGDLGESASLRSSLGIPPEAPVLLWVGRPGPVKRVPILIEAFSRVLPGRADVHLVLVGDFSNEPAVHQMVHSLGLESYVHFPGKAAHEDLPAYYRMAAMYVHSSIYEGLGKVLIEAAACARPVVSTRTSGAQEIVVDQQTGLLCDLDHPEDMAHKIALLLDDPVRAEAMGQAGRKFVLDKFDHVRNLAAVIDTWRHCAIRKVG